MGQKGLWNVAKNRDATPKEEGNRECKAMHEDNLPSTTGVTRVTIARWIRANGVPGRTVRALRSGTELSPISSLRPQVAYWALFGLPFPSRSEQSTGVERLNETHMLRPQPLPPWDTLILLV